MRTTFTLGLCLLVFIADHSLKACDTIQVKMITHMYLGGPSEMEWDLEDEGNGLDILDGTHIFSINDSVFSFEACLDTGCYRARARFDHDIEMGMFEIWVTLNGDTLPVYDDIDYGDEDYKYYFPLHTFCEDDDLSTIEIGNESATFPNPADEYIQIEHPYLTMGSTIEVKNRSGQLVHQQEVSSQDLRIKCSEWPNGMYIIYVKSENYQSIIASKSIVSH